MTVTFIDSSPQHCELDELRVLVVVGFSSPHDLLNSHCTGLFIPVLILILIDVLVLVLTLRLILVLTFRLVLTLRLSTSVTVHRRHLMLHIHWHVGNLDVRTDPVGSPPRSPVPARSGISTVFRMI